MIGQLSNHLVQSTLFAFAAALLVLAFRRNRARVRYSLWLAASLKFLIPFSILIALGSQIHGTPAAQAIATHTASADIVQTVEQFSEPFTVTIPAHPRQTDRRPSAIAAIWFSGFAWIMVLRLRAWRGMRLAIRRSQPLDLGLPIEARLSQGVLEPGIVGLWRPMLLLPQGILERLTPSELEAVIAHELCHIRRRDNLFAAIHMLIEAVFWFHPLVWWIGARLLDERERACDEYVVSQGNQPDIYADAILNVCKLYTESPLACVSGVTGADIRRRLEAIMSNQKAAGLNFAKKTLLTCAAIVTVATPLTIGLLIGIGNVPHLLAQSQRAPVEPLPASPEPIRVGQIQAAPPVQIVPAPKPSATQSVSAPAPKFDVVSIRLCKDFNGGPGRSGGGGAPMATPGHLRMNCSSVRSLILRAFRDDNSSPRGTPLEGGPAWIDSDLYTIEAEADGAPDSMAMYGRMLQALLEDRFQLKIHKETRDVPAYGLTVAKGGPKLQSFQDGECTQHLPGAPRPRPDEKPWCGMGGMRTVRNGSNVSWDVRGASFLNFSTFFGIVLDRPLVDKTGITGMFDFHLEFAPDETTAGVASPFAPIAGPQATPSDPAGGPSIFTAFQNQLGLKLEAAKAPGEVLVVDRVERPSEN